MMEQTLVCIGPDRDVMVESTTYQGTDDDMLDLVLTRQGTDHHMLVQNLVCVKERTLTC